MSVATESLANKLDAMQELRTFPAVASRLISACNRELVTVRELTDIIKCDPSLVIRLLRIANSPIYGFSGRITSIDHATVVLGMRGLRNLAISASTSDLFDSSDPVTGPVCRELLRHSLACGCVARLLAAHVREVSADEAFLAGVVHDVGKLFVLDHDPAGYPTLMGRGSADQIVVDETDRYGIAHTTIGQQCGLNWGLPDVINDVIAFHHEPKNAEYGSPLVDLIYVSNHLASGWFSDVAEDHPSPEALLERVDLKIHPGCLDDVQEKSLKSLNEIISILS